MDIKDVVKFKAISKYGNDVDIFIDKISKAWTEFQANGGWYKK